LHVHLIPVRCINIVAQQVLISLFDQVEFAVHCVNTAAYYQQEAAKLAKERLAIGEPFSSAANAHGLFPPCGYVCHGAEKIMQVRYFV